MNYRFGVCLLLLIALPIFAQDQSDSWVESGKSFLYWVLIYFVPTFALTVAVCGGAYYKWRNVKIWHYSPVVFAFWAIVYMLYLGLTK